MRTARIFASTWLALSLLAAGPARPAITPEAKAVVDRFVEASGGRAALAHAHAMHFKGSLRAFGLTGTIETWRKNPDKRASSVAIGPIAIRDGSSGGHSWRIDPSGKLLTLDGKDLADAQASAWFETDHWLDPDQGGGSITLRPDVSDTLGTFTVLEVTPPSGKPRELEFDKKTALLVRTISRNDQTLVVSTNFDFRKVDGWMVAFKRTQEVVGMPTNNATITLDAVEFPADIPDDRFAPPATASAPAVAWLKTSGVARIPFAYRGHHVWVRASVNGGPPADFIYDTGASITVIDSAYAAQIGLKGSGKIQAQGGGAAGGAAFATLDSLRIASPDADGVALHDVKVALVNVNSAFAPFFWRDCAGIIGFDTIGQFVNRIDFDGRELVFYDPKTFTYQGKGAAIPMALAGHTPVVNIRVDGQYEGGARVDIGSGSMLDLHTPFVQKYGLIARAGKSVPVTDGGIGGTFESRYTRMRSVEVGPYKLVDPLVGLSTVVHGALASEDYAGNIGNEMLDHFVVTLDYDRRQIWLEPGAHYGERRNFSRVGAQLLKYGDDVRAAQVLVGSPAATAGLKAGDVVTAVDGVPVSRIDPDQLERKFEDGAPGSKVALSVTRGGQPRTLTVTLKEIL